MACCVWRCLEAPLVGNVDFTGFRAVDGIEWRGTEALYAVLPTRPFISAVFPSRSEFLSLGTAGTLGWIVLCRAELSCVPWGV